MGSSLERKTPSFRFGFLSWSPNSSEATLPQHLSRHVRTRYRMWWIKLWYIWLSFVIPFPYNMDSRERNYIHLKQANHNAYLGFCGKRRHCDGSSHGVYGYRSRSHHRTKFEIEQSGGYYYLKQVDHSYLGMCGNARECGGSHHNIFGYSSRKSRTRWQVVLPDNVGWEEVQTN